MSSERTPLLRHRSQLTFDEEDPDSMHAQFCMLTGVPPSNLRPGAKQPTPGSKTLYGRATKLKSSTNSTYMFTATLSNSLLLGQVVLGAAVTALGASESSHVLITLFGAMNTIIAGLVAYLKSRGQPMRARMFRDDLERVVDEIQNSEIMWLGISKKVHGYDDIDTYDTVTVRSEVARLTRLYDRALRNNSLNNPDMYMAGGPSDGGASGLKPKPLHQTNTHTPAPQTTAGAPASSDDPDESPASAPPKPPPPPTPKLTPTVSTPAAQDPPVTSTPPPVAPDAATSAPPASAPAPAPATVSAAGESTQPDPKPVDTPAPAAKVEDSKTATPAPATKSEDSK